MYRVKLVGNNCNEYYAVDAIINGETESCMIDTGFNGFIIRQDFQKENVNNSEKFFKNEEGNLLINNDIQTVVLSNVTYKKINAVYSGDGVVFDYDESTGLNNAKNALVYQTDFGYPFFKNHIIQLDFENNVFRIR